MQIEKALTVYFVFSVRLTITWKPEHLWMWKFECLLFLLKWSYIRYYIICMTVLLNHLLIESQVLQELIHNNIYWIKMQEMKFIYESYLLLNQIYIICWLSLEYRKSYFVIILIKLRCNKWNSSESV